MAGRGNSPPNGDPGTDVLDEVRGYFTRYDDLLDPGPKGPIDLAALRVTIAQAHRTYQAAQYGSAIGQIAPMLSGVDKASRGLAAARDKELMLGYVSALFEPGRRANLTEA